MIGGFFVWCAGSDTNVLSKCEDSVRTKHIGIGTLVVIPAFLGFISMTYALSTIDKLRSNPTMFILGGLSWGLIVFAFDRFIVSTHKKQQNNIDEFKNITFYLRLLFAFVLGIVVSHPFVLLYFDGSITERIITDRNKAIKFEEIAYQKSYDTLTVTLNDLIKKKRCNERLLRAESSGVAINSDCGSSSGHRNVRGTFPFTTEIKNTINGLNTEITNEKNRIAPINESLLKLKKLSQQDISKSTSFDLIKFERVLKKMKKEDDIVGLTEFFLMCAFMLVDILPLIFKTFSSFSMYDKILYDDTILLRDINTASRKITLQKAYDKISKTYAESRSLDNPVDYKGSLEKLLKNINYGKNILLGLSLGIGIAFFLYFYSGIDPTENIVLFFSTILSITVSIIANFITELLKNISKKEA